MRWVSPSPGACPQVIIGEWRYYIQDFPDWKGVVIMKVPAKRIKRHHCETFHQLYRELTGQEHHGSEFDVHWDLRLLCSKNCGQDLWDYERDGHHYAVCFGTKEWWEWYPGERVGPLFADARDAKDWAEENYALLSGVEQMRLDV